MRSFMSMPLSSASEEERSSESSGAADSSCSCIVCCSNGWMVIACSCFSASLMTGANASVSSSFSSSCSSELSSSSLDEYPPTNALDCVAGFLRASFDSEDVSNGSSLTSESCIVSSGSLFVDFPRR
ncbi:hypothetical protein WICPIJ_004473 [Wickerhamomyces pijperi]|uniref:Uncharacterized protein n=1 Tax=Wickerhamomyces pijperi TaxID=599730 RepID=A0A9P8Q5I5_WICPI|nr:hypothetical protein WICPIJ_004473 [Wickerhamomyces pijperi]